jgi:tetratricopeptide (TPR) repeat protein
MLHLSIKSYRFIGICIAVPLLIIAIVFLSNSKAHSDPPHQAIEIASRLTETASEALICDWLSTLVFSERQGFAFAFADKMDSNVQRFQAYIFIADAFVKVGKTSEAQQTLEKAGQIALRITPSDAQLRAFALLAVKRGDTDDALSKAREIVDEINRSNTLSDICMALISLGDFDAAIRSAYEDVFPEVRPRLMLKIAKALLESGQSDRGKTIARGAFALTSGLSYARYDIFNSFAPVLVKAGLSHELLENFQVLGKRGVYSDAKAVESVAVEFAKSGDLKKSLEIARNITSETEDDQARALAAISQALREMGRKGEAESILTEALNTALRIAFPAHRSWALHKIAPMLVRVGRIDEALNAVQTLGANNEPQALVAIALAETGDLDLAIKVAAESFATTPILNFPSTIISSGILIRFVQALMKAGRLDEAERFVQIAYDKLAIIRDPDAQSGPYGVAAQASALVGKWGQAIVAAEFCEQPIDKLAASTAIVRAYSISQNPALEKRFEKAIE